MTDFPRPILTVDVVVLELRDTGLWLGTIARDSAPFPQMPALPGGYVHVDTDKDTADTARRVIKAKAGLTDIFCEQLGTFSGADRDPRGWSATVVYYALIRGARPKGAGLVWVPAGNPGVLAFDHNELVAAALDRLRAKGSWSNLPAFLLAKTFTLAELRQTYETILGTSLNDSAFRRKMEELDLIEPVIGKKSKSTARPAQIYRLKQGALRAFDRRI